MINMFRTKAGYTEQCNNITEKMTNDIDKSVFKWLKEEYNFVYIKTIKLKQKYSMTTFVIPSDEKLELENEIDLSKVREVLRRYKIDYKNLTFEQFYSSVLFRF